MHSILVFAFVKGTRGGRRGERNSKEGRAFWQRKSRRDAAREREEEPTLAEVEQAAANQHLELQ